MPWRARAKKLTHLGTRGEAHMVDVSAKPATERVAVAEGRVLMQAKTLDIVRKRQRQKRRRARHRPHRRHHGRQAHP